MKRVIFYIRYYISREFLRFGLIVLPDGEYKQELLSRVYGLKNEAIDQAKARKELK